MSNEILTRLAGIEARLALLEARPNVAATSAVGELASDYELSGQYGDPVIKKDPKRWDGASYVGQTYSQCPSDYLECLASLLDWKADRESSEPERAKYASYSRLDAKRARGWAARNKGKPATGFATSQASSNSRTKQPEALLGDDEIPF